MKTKPWNGWFTMTLAVLSSVLTSYAGEGAVVPDQRLVGQWHGQNEFYGMSYQEIKGNKVAIQNVETSFNISTNGSVTGRVGGARLSECVVMVNRGWLGRLLHIETDFIIRGMVVGTVAPGSDDGTNDINAPFNFKGPRIKGTVFSVRGPFTYPYPILNLRLEH
jgi:hypothetical protein